MDRETVLNTILDERLVAIATVAEPIDMLEVAKALYEGGVRVVEVTLRSPKSFDCLAALVSDWSGKMIVGAGTVLDPETAKRAIDAGAQFLVSPTLSVETIRTCRRYSRIAIPGALTPTEILSAWEAGADIVKVFPAKEVGGPAYFRAVRGPLPHIRMMPTGGVTLESVGDYLAAGACGVGPGSTLVEPKAVAAHEWGRITSLARQFVQAVSAANKSS